MKLFKELFRVRDAPQNRTSGSSYSFFMGNSTSGKRVNERSSMQMTAVYSCVRILSEAVASLPLHFYEYGENGSKVKAINHPLYRILHDEPNPEMTSFVFRETLMTHLLLWGKEKKKNEGEIPQYYVTGNHEAIISPTTFDRVQKMLEQRISGKNRISSVSIFSGKIKCGDCGSWFGSKVWHSNSKYKQKIWQCNHKFEDKCKTTHLTEDEIESLFIKAVNSLIDNKKEIILTHREMAKSIFDVTELESEKFLLEDELNLIADKVNECISKNAKVVQNQEEYEKAYSRLVEKFNTTKSRLDEISQEINKKKCSHYEVNDFINNLEKQDLLNEFDENVWLSMVDCMTVYQDDKIEFTFIDGSKIELNR